MREPPMNMMSFFGGGLRYRFLVPHFSHLR